MLYNIKKYIITAFILTTIVFGSCASKDKVLTFGLDSPEKADDNPDEIPGNEQNVSGEDMGESAADTESAGEKSDEDSSLLCVYVCGAVNDPGVVFLPEGSRIKDALALAGGLSQDADPVRINLAEKIFDGEQIYFPKEGEEVLTASDTGSPGTGNDPGPMEKSGLVDINRADKKLLCTLPGIGEVKAEAIIKYRAENGPFPNISGVKQVPGISEGLYEKIKDYICTNSK